MANDRNAGRKSKYKFKSTTITFRVPSDVEELCRDAVREIISTKAALFGAVDSVPEMPENPKSVPESSTTPKKCDCYLDGTIMKRGKSKPTCKRTKAQHKF